ncbi:MAG: 2Fe-2S iron-sulfur cluster-binding protein [Alphaproteobacteria bacterium]
MPTVTFMQPDGTANVVETDLGSNVREAAVQNDVPGIDGDCGGACACATCHVYVTPDWIDKTGTVEPDSMEESLLQFADERRDNSRLGCQIQITVALDGLVVEVPLGQH